MLRVVVIEKEPKNRGPVYCLPSGRREEPLKACPPPSA